MDESAFQALVREARERRGERLRGASVSPVIPFQWLGKYEHGERRLFDDQRETYKRELVTRYPELAEPLVELSLAWLPDAARARLALAWAPADDE